jgi:hypothetical protein
MGPLLQYALSTSIKGDVEDSTPESISRDDREDDRGHIECPDSSQRASKEQYQLIGDRIWDPNLLQKDQ